MAIKSREQKPESIWLSATARAKLEYLRVWSDNHEFTCFGITQGADVLSVLDLRLPTQEVSGGSADIDGDALGEYMERCAADGIEPINCARVWVHSHPFSDNPGPSTIDDHALDSELADSDWIAMIIVGKTGEGNAWLSLQRPFRLRVSIPVLVDWALPFDGFNLQAWRAEFDANVATRRSVVTYNTSCDSWINSKGKNRNKGTDKKSTRIIESCDLPVGRGIYPSLRKMPSGQYRFCRHGLDHQDALNRFEETQELVPVDAEYDDDSGVIKSGYIALPNGEVMSVEEWRARGESNAE